jgi:hypothetical protein
MDTLVHRLNTVKVKPNQVKELVSDLKKWQIRHRPFSRQGDMIHVILYHCAKADWVLLKYG